MKHKDGISDALGQRSLMAPGRGPIKPGLLPQKRTRESKLGLGHSRVGRSGKETPAPTLWV